MYSVLKYLTQNAVAGRASNSELAGGLPHSEIRGSKPILGYPRLIAEYHVLHRLLLPRHSPNALLALDLIQRGQDESCMARRLAAPRLRFRIKSILSRQARLAPRPDYDGPESPSRVSVLDLDSLPRFRADPEDATHLRRPEQTVLYLSSRCQRTLRSPSGLDGRAARRAVLRSGPGCGMVSEARCGGAYRDRTGDLLNANQALSQLS